MVRHSTLNDNDTDVQEFKRIYSEIPDNSLLKEAWEKANELSNLEISLNPNQEQVIRNPERNEKIKQRRELAMWFNEHEEYKNR